MSTNRVNKEVDKRRRSHLKTKKMFAYVLKGVCNYVVYGNMGQGSFYS